MCVTNNYGYILFVLINPIISPLTIYHRVCKKSNRNGAAIGAGTSNPSAAHVYTSGYLWRFVLLDL
jgi:hypothetical protein